MYVFIYMYLNYNFPLSMSLYLALSYLVNEEICLNKPATTIQNFQYCETVHDKCLLGGSPCMDRQVLDITRFMSCQVSHVKNL